MRGQRPSLTSLLCSNIGMLLSFYIITLLNNIIETIILMPRPTTSEPPFLLALAQVIDSIVHLVHANAPRL